jgi:hypothetical protein
MPSKAEDAQALYVRDSEFRDHLKALGLASPEEYAQWCASNGFSPRLGKHWRQRSRERYFAARDRVQQRVQQVKADRRNPQLAWLRVVEGACDAVNLPPFWRLLYEQFRSLQDQAAQQALCDLLIHCHAHSRLLTLRVPVPRLGTQQGNTFAEGLIELAKNSSKWIRAVSTWLPRTRNASRQFASLAAHLFAKYPLPAVMDSVWFRGPSPEACQQRAWYLALAAGSSPRALDFPIPLTRHMAHHFQRAPHDMLVEEALRHAQVQALGGTARLARAILDSRLATNFAHNEFWMSVIRWLARNPELDLRHVAPLIDYIHHQKYQPPAAPGEGLAQQAPSPDFSMQGRTAAGLLHQMHAWHAQLRNETTAASTKFFWNPSGVAPFELCEGALASGNLRRWTIVELLSRQELFEEGRQLRHCVASYVYSCVSGGTSIWSLGVERNTGPRKRVLTIEVSVNRKAIRQVRGKANRLPTEKEQEVVRRWALQAQLNYKVY